MVPCQRRDMNVRTHKRLVSAGRLVSSKSVRQPNIRESSLGELEGGNVLGITI
jgi:hypothetical protein